MAFCLAQSDVEFEVRGPSPRLFFLFPEIADGLLEPGLEVGMAAPAADFLEDEFGRLGLIAQRAVGVTRGRFGSGGRFGLRRRRAAIGGRREEIFHAGLYRLLDELGDDSRDEDLFALGESADKFGCVGREPGGEGFFFRGFCHADVLPLRCR